MRIETVYVAMSGGVDSSVAAALLKKQGFRVVGVFMKPWSSPTSNSKSEILNSKKTQNSKFRILNSEFCMWKQDREDAMRVASVLDIPLKTWDFSREYGQKVVRYMIGGYRRGITPNPDVMCNKEIKFGLFFRKAMREGADRIATGHYVRVREVKSQKLKVKNSGQNPKVLELLKGIDDDKDQSYFLWTLTQKELARTLFPIGDLTKPQVRRLAKRFGLPNHDKKDSQGVCFVGPLDVKEFLARKIEPRTGLVKHVDGRVLGEHDGAFFYTIGQRHGIDLGIAGGPYLVVRKDMRKNIVYVGSERDILGSRARITNIRWVRNIPQAFPLAIEAKIRYRTPAAAALLHRDGMLEFKKPQRAVTPGQSAVFYRGLEVLGGGVIA